MFIFLSIQQVLWNRLRWYDNGSKSSFDGNIFDQLNLSSCVIFSAVALRGRPLHRSGGKRSICERSRMLSPAGHSPGTPLLRCFSNPLLRFRCRFRSQPGSSRAVRFALAVVNLPVVDLGNG